MNITADLHTHTIVSNHAYSTLHEMVTQAAQLGHFAMAVTDHGPALPDAPHPWYFYNLYTLPRRIGGVWLLRGTEANVQDAAGTLDFTAQDFERFALDWVIVSIHSDAMREPLDYESATRLWLNVAQNPYVDMIGHSEMQRYVYDYDRVTKVFAQQGKVVELNANSAVVRPGSEENMRQLALACKKNGTKVAVNSDAHCLYSLGCVDPILKLLEEIEFPSALVVNASPENLVNELKLHGKAVATMMEESLG